MAGPYDYTINIPQPPAQNFLQSLLGIQQLKGLQQQSQLAEQQAAIQQQNAAFQQQMQPLQLEAERARINQLGQSAAAAEEALFQSKKRFEQEQQDRARGIEQQAAAQARQNELYGRLTSMPADAPMSDVVKIANELALIKPEIAKQVVANFQTYPEQFQKAAETTLVTATTQLQSDNIEGARKTYADFAEAVKNSGAKNNPQLQSLVNSAEAQAKLLGAQTPLATNIAKLSSLQLLGSINPKALDAIVALEKTQAEGAISSSKQKQVDEEKRALELEKLRLQNRELEQKVEQAKPEKSLPSAILRENAAIDKKVAAANEMADKLSQAAEAMRGLPSVGSAKEWWTNVKPKLGFGENPEIAVRTNAAQLAGLGMLGAESSAMGGAIRSNVQFQYATSKLPDAWSAPQEVAKRLDAQAEVQRKLAQLMTIDAEWNSAFRGSQKATKDEQILGMDVEPGTTKAKFKEMAAKQLFPSGKEASAPTKTEKITGTPDLQSLLNKYR